MRSNLQDYTERPKLYDNIDGTGEMFMGLMLLGFALAGYGESQLAESASRWTHGLVLYGVLLPTIAFGFWGRKKIKSHLTWPRTGYAVQGRARSNKPWWEVLLLSALVAVGGVVAGFWVVTTRHQSPLLTRTSLLATWVMVYGVWVWQMGRRRPWKWMMVAAMAIGLVTIAFIIPGNIDQLFQPAALFVGLVWLASGAATLVLYLHSAPRPESDPE